MECKRGPPFQSISGVSSHGSIAGSEALSGWHTQGYTEGTRCQTNLEDLNHFHTDLYSSVIPVTNFREKCRKTNLFILYVDADTYLCMKNSADPDPH